MGIGLEEGVVFVHPSLAELAEDGVRMDATRDALGELVPQPFVALTSFTSLRSLVVTLMSSLSRQLQGASEGIEPEDRR